MNICAKLGVFKNVLPLHFNICRLYRVGQKSKPQSPIQLVTGAGVEQLHYTDRDQGFNHYIQPPHATITHRVHGGPKTKLSYFVHIFAKYWPIFTIFSPVDSVGNLLLIGRHTTPTVKIGQYLAKIWTKYDSLVFFWVTLYLYTPPQNTSWLCGSNWTWHEHTHLQTQERAVFNVLRVMLLWSHHLQAIFQFSLCLLIPTS